MSISDWTETWNEFEVDLLKGLAVKPRDGWKLKLMLRKLIVLVIDSVKCEVENESRDC